ncbi:MAG: thermonuclease family protein [Methylotenera sp.]|nr:thermonuclease family protein [Methylotenera sp.]
MVVTRRVVAGLLLLFATVSQADNSYTVSRIYDGDTVLLKNSRGKLKLRLTDIDAPERNQAYGQKSRRALSKLCKGAKISVTTQITGTDKYDRSLGKLQCNGVDAGLYLVKHGLAWHNAKYSSNHTTLNAEAIARQKRLGLWRNKKPIPPWVWRHTHTYH